MHTHLNTLVLPYQQQQYTQTYIDTHILVDAHTYSHERTHMFKKESNFHISTITHMHVHTHEHYDNTDSSKQNNNNNTHT